MKYSRIRELWAVPKYKNYFKLGGWLLFFIIIFILYAFSVDNTPVSNNNKVNNSINYEQMKINLSEENLRISYYITVDRSYFIEGTLINGVIEGTLETAEVIRIKITEENTYLISRDEIKPTYILENLNLLLLFPKNIIDIINKEGVVRTESEDGRIFFYTINDINISLHINEEQIYQIVILDGNNTYELNISII